MRLIKQEVVDKAAEKFDKKVPLGKLQTDYIFKAGVEFAETQISELAIEFANWILENDIMFELYARNKLDSKSLFEIFIKERNNE
jgi:hypothetical protein